MSTIDSVSSQEIHGDEFRKFQPRLALGYSARLHSLNRLVCTARPDAALQMIKLELLEAVDHRENLAQSGMSPEDLEPTTAWIAALHLMRDLCSQGWTFIPDDEGMVLRSPGRAGGLMENPEQAKVAVRKSFDFARLQQFAEPSTVAFVEKMERQGIHRLFEDGPDLSARLRQRGIDAVEPVLQLIEPGMRDQATGIALQDIWRYARLYWSIPYQSTPGRNMFYLIRDHGAESQPIIGIAALGNPVLGLARRDDFAGWTLQSLRTRLAASSSEARTQTLKQLLSSVQDGIQSVYVDDFDFSIDDDDLPRTLHRLAEVEALHANNQLDEQERSGGTRTTEYREIRDAQNAIGKDSEASVDWVAVARTSLYTAKRASTLASFVRARAELRRALVSTKRDQLLLDLNESLARAMDVALRRIKQDAMATSVMELITCGALPPYRALLGGKLVAMLMSSPQVVNDYSRRYANQTSLISSSLAGKRIVRMAHLAMITTSSLYSIGSAQYNRISIPADLGQIKYIRVGMTDSFGTVHFASDTVRELTEIAVLRGRNLSRSNNLFGEGTSAKLRTVRSGLDALGLRSDVFLRHHSPRVLYAVPLARNYEDVLHGKSERPDYLFAGSKTDHVATIVAHWKKRWLAPRIDRILKSDQLGEVLRSEFLLGNELKSVTPKERRTAVGTLDVQAVASDASTFIERLYRGANSYADRLSPEEIEQVNVDLGIENYLLLHCTQGSQIVVTGNPGDGKTHLIERMRPSLESVGALVITDANALSDDEILGVWLKARAEKRAFIIAINEWPLYVLHRHAERSGHLFVGEALRQVQEAQYFAGDAIPVPPSDGIVTVDLGLRNLLTEDVVHDVIRRLTDETFYTSMNAADPALRNRTALLDESIRARLIELLRGVSLRRGHVTMRQLMGFIAYLITGGRSAPERIKAGQDAAGMSYWSLAFEGGVGPLFGALREGFDPADCAHPDWDDRLWRGDYTASEWPLGNAPVPAISAPDSARAFAAQKRQFYFEHPEGGELLNLRPSDDRTFASILHDVSHDSALTVRLFIGAINRFYEPDFSDSGADRLHLWQSLRYDVRSPSAFVAVRNAEREAFSIREQQFASWVTDWLPKSQQLVKVFALGFTKGGKTIATLEIDRDLYLTLQEAHRGLGKASWLRTSARRLTRLVDKLDRELTHVRNIEDVRIRNVDTNQESTIIVNRVQMRFELN